MARPLWCGVAWLVLGHASLATAFDVEIKAAPKCVGLSYSAIKQSPYLTSTGTQFAEFNLTCQVTNLPPGATVSYQWAPVQTENPQNPPAGAIWVPAPGTAASTVGWAYGTVGLFTANCTVTVSAPQGGGQHTSIRSFLVVEGPLNLQAQAFLSPDGTSDQNYIETWPHDLSEADKPHFMHYFGNDPTLPNTAEVEQEDFSDAQYPYGWIRRTRPIVLDNLGQRMPDVWIQERFQPPLPPEGSSINSSLTWWLTSVGRTTRLAATRRGGLDSGAVEPARTAGTTFGSGEPSRTPTQLTRSTTLATVTTQARESLSAQGTGVSSALTGSSYGQTESTPSRSK